MGSIKVVAIAFVISFFIILFITNDALRKETFEILNHKIGKKGKIKVKSIFIILVSIIVILVCEKKIYKITVLNRLLAQASEQNTEQSEEENNNYEEE